MVRNNILWVTDGARTRDNRFHRAVLYQLSYSHQDKNIYQLTCFVVLYYSRTEPE